MSERWHRDDFAEAVWASDLRPLERLVALAYADHARDERYAFVTYGRLREVTGLSRDAIHRAIRGLVQAKWLELKEAGAQHKAPRYWLRIPDQQSGTQTAEGEQESGSQTAEGTSSPGDGHLDALSSPPPDTSSPPPDTSSPPDGPDLSSDYSEDLSDAREDVLTAGTEQVLRKLGPCDDARAIAEAVLEDFRRRKGHDPDDLARYVGGIVKRKGAKGLARFRSGSASTGGPGVDRCEHNEVGGMRILGSGPAASRKCGRCDTEHPVHQEAKVG